MIADITNIINHECFTELDRQFAYFMAKLSGTENNELMLTSLLVSNRTGKGDICLDIPSIAGRELFDVLIEREDCHTKYKLPDKDKWISRLRKSNVVGGPHEFKPLILDDTGRLYLYRYWNYERLLAESITARIMIGSCDFDASLLRDGIKRLFPGNSEAERDEEWQRIAAIAAVKKKFCVISGGPGTGKTSTVAGILVLLLEQAKARGNKPTIALTAPTGKAAARLKESIKLAKESLRCSDDIKQDIPDEAFTIHRLLGPIPGSPYFRYNKDNQLSYDIVVVDESSMADLALLAKLFDAVPKNSRLILLGDKDQLASVEAGAALGDICDTGNEHGYSHDLIASIEEAIGKMDITAKKEPQIADSLIILRKSYRFDEESGIGAVSSAVRDGRADDAIDLLKNNKFPDIQLVDISQDNLFSKNISNYIENGYRPYLTSNTVKESFSLFSRFAILCAHRNGPSGVERINELSEKILKTKGLINPNNRWYHGRPLMINRNDYNLKLFNGDIGIIFPDHDSEDKPRFYSPSPEGHLRKILPLKLPEHETAYAMTVHKSQGSEFDHVLVLLSEKESPVLTRELLYTAISRARNRVDIFGSEKILRYMIMRPTIRKSGLRDSLWN